jgi:hypothetical protein
MCNPNWTAWECISAAYLVQMLFIGIGLVSGIISLVSRDIAATLLNQKPFLKIKDFEFNPLMPRKVRLGLQGAGIALVTVGVLWIAVAEIKSSLISRLNRPVYSEMTISTMPAGISLAGLAYVSGDWNPRQIDLRTAATAGIYVNPQASFRLMDLQVTVLGEIPSTSYQLQAKVFANDEKEIGETKIVDLIPGLVNLGDVDPTNFQHATISNAWLPQKDWGKLTVVLNIIEKGQDQIIQSTKTDVLFSDQTRAWFLAPPYANLVAIVYQINDGEKSVMDLRLALVQGIPAKPGDRLRISEIWSHSLAQDSTKILFAEAYLSSGDYDSATHAQTSSVIFEKGVQNLMEGKPFEWTIQDGKKSLIITLSRDNGQEPSIVLDRYEIALNPAAPDGLITVPSSKTWPDGNLTYLDFEDANSLENWVAAEPVKFELSNQYAISGGQSLAVTIQATTSDSKQETAVRKVPFQASLIIGQVYWPSQPGVQVEWAQFCITQAWQCVKIPVEANRWNTFFMDLSTMKGVDGKTLDQIEPPSFFIQGSFIGDTLGMPYTFYIDGIQIYPTQKP